MIEILQTVAQVAWSLFEWQVNGPLDVLGLLFIWYIVTNYRGVDA
jgi:hypothetical protein